MKLLALDLSTSIIGWSIFEDGKLVKYGHIDLKKVDSVPYLKVDEAFKQLSALVDKEGITEMVAEAALQRVSGGKSTAHIVNLLIAFNFAVSYLLRTYKGIKVSHISFSTARALTKIKFVKRSTSKQKKELVRQYCEARHPWIVWEKKKTGTYKDWCYDRSDSIIIGEAHFEQQRTEIPISEAGVPKRKRKVASKQK